VCSISLYFFFQGYYPDVRVGLRHIFSESGSENSSGSSDLIRSFGIINVRTTPIDANIILGGGVYGNNEKRMSDYGEYTMSIEKSGFLWNSLQFKIDREKPFFIEKIVLLPTPTYEKNEKIQNIYSLNDGEFLIRTASGIISSGSIVLGSTGITDHIGGKYFRTNTGILTWEWTKFQKSSQDISNFIQTCSNIDWKYGILFCPTSQSILTTGDRYMTGILDIQNDMIIKSGAIIAHKKWELGKIFSQTGWIDTNNVIIFDNILFTKKAGTLISKTSPEKNITSTLDTISHILSLGEEVILLGKIGWKTHLIIRHTGDPIDRERDIELPSNLSYVNIQFHSIDGNIMIESPLGILFVYRWSTSYQWIIEGSILNYSSTWAQYMKDWQIWFTDWSKKIE
jgi:hypothetical protein